MIKSRREQAETHSARPDPELFGAETHIFGLLASLVGAECGEDAKLRDSSPQRTINPRRRA
jgi:hypothetical protein